MALQEVLNSSIWVIKDNKSNYQPLYGQFLYALNTDASGDDDKGVLYVGNGTEWINVMGTALSSVVESILATVPFEQIDNKTIFDAINEKANKATTLEGYGIEDAYTKTTIDAIILALEAELAGKQDKLTAGDNISIDKNKISVTGLTKASVGLDQVDNTSDADKPISTATQTALDLKADKSQVASELAGKQDKLTAGTNISISDVNEISVVGLTKASVGLDKVDNTSDAEKPISTATQTALNAKQDVSNLVTEFGETTSDTKYPSEKLVHSKISQLATDFNRQLGSKADANANNITEAYVASWKTKLGVSDLETSVAGKQDTLTAGDNISIDGNKISVTGVYTSTQVDGLLANKANKSTTLAGYGITDANISDGTITLGENSITPLTANSTIPADKITGLTKASVGLGNVDNTSDANKPISTATQTALNAKQDKLTAGTNISISDTNAISVTGLTKASVGLGNVDNTSDANKPISTATQTALNAKQDVSNLVTSFGVTPSDTKYPSEKLVNDVLSQTNQRITGIENDTQALSTNKQDKLTAGDNISIDKNKISVTGLTKASVGLGNVDNTSDANKPISTATQTALDLKADKSQVASELAGKQDKLTAGTNITITGTTISAKDTTYTAGTNIAISDTNVISVTGLTKASVGLGNVDNTSDANKPISTATQTALNAKQNVANLVTTIDSTSDDTHYPSAKAVYTAIDELRDEVTSTVETTVTPTTAQTATAITGALAKKARVVVVPSLANAGAIYIKESDTYSSVNPIYPDPTNNVYEFTNMQNVKVFVDSVGDSVDLVIEYRG